MAYIGQEKKKEVHAELKKVIPASWKWSLSIRHHMSLVLTISSAPFAILPYVDEKGITHERTELSPYAQNLKNTTSDPKLKVVLEKIQAALYDGNWDKSDIQTDYFNVGWYVDVKIGRWDKPFISTDSTVKVGETRYSH